MLNWSWLYYKDETFHPLSDFENIIIELRQAKIYEALNGPAIKRQNLRTSVRGKKNMKKKSQLEVIMSDQKISEKQ